MKLVLDASVAIAAARPNEPAHAASRARVARVLSGADELIVPAIFAIEVGASLVRVGEPVAPARAYVDALVTAASKVATIGPRSATRIRDLAMLLRLRAADAAYVWLASTEGVPLCTLDDETRQRGASVCTTVLP